jgi:hypothetical protein
MLTGESKSRKWLVLAVSFWTFLGFVLKYRTMVRCSNTPQDAPVVGGAVETQEFFLSLVSDQWLLHSTRRLVSGTIVGSYLSPGTHMKPHGTGQTCSFRGQPPQSSGSCGWHPLLPSL